MTECRFVFPGDLRASPVQNFVSDLRGAGRSAQTCNFYLQAAKQFVRWMVQDRRLKDNPLRGLSQMNVRADRRHDRRALYDDEFRRLLEAARHGKVIEKISGPERRMLYLLSAWTGFRRKELASLNRRSLDLASDYPSVTVSAAYSKNGRDDTLPLHSYVVEELRNWLGDQSIADANSPLFGLKTASEKLRRTSKMMQCDLEAAARCGSSRPTRPRNGSVGRSQIS